jgi:hypothetical protein
MTDEVDILGRVLRAKLSGGNTGIEPSAREARIAAATLQLFDLAGALGFTISADGRVGEPDAATLLRLHRDTLARKRVEGSGPPAYGIGIGRFRISYRLRDIAHWIEEHREKFDMDST